MLKSKFIAIMAMLVFTVSAQTVIYKYTKEQKASYASFAAYLTAVGSTNTSWEMGKDIAIAATTHIQSNIDIRSIMNGAKFTGASTLYIGKMSAKPEGQIFDTSLTVFFDSGSVSEVYTHWWGNNKAAIKRAVAASGLNGIALVVSKYNYPISGKVATGTSSDISRFTKGGMLKGNTGSATDTLLIAGKFSAHPDYQIFDTSLTVIITPSASNWMNREWFGSAARFATAKASGNPPRWIDGGSTTIDSLSASIIVGANAIRGNPDIDSISGNPFFGNGLVASGHVNCDTLSVSTYVQKDTAFACTLMDDAAVEAESGANAKMVGDIVILRIPAMGPCSIAGVASIHISNKFNTDAVFPIRLYNNGAYEIGIAYFSAAGVITLKDAAGSDLTGNSGTVKTCITYYY